MEGMQAAGRSTQRAAAARLGGGAVALEVGLELVDALGVAHKGERVKVDARLDAKVDVAPVALRDGRQVGRLAADVEVAAAAHLAAVDHL